MHAQSQTHQNLALFDFDGTLCQCDSFTGFMFYAHTKRHVIQRGLRILPWILAYYLRCYSADKMRPKLYAALFKHSSARHMQYHARHYAHQLLHQLDNTILHQLQQHQARGDRVILVSASLDVYLKPVCEYLGIELLCTEVQQGHVILNGQYRSPDCSGVEKVRRIQQHCDLSQYKTIYAYGNSDEDLAMLRLADYPYMHGKDQSLPILDKPSIYEQ